MAVFGQRKCDLCDNESSGRYELAPDWVGGSWPSLFTFYSLCHEHVDKLMDAIVSVLE